MWVAGEISAMNGTKFPNMGKYKCSNITKKISAAFSSKEEGSKK